MRQLWVISIIKYVGFVFSDFNGVSFTICYDVFCDAIMKIKVLLVIKVWPMDQSKTVT